MQIDIPPAEQQKLAAKAIAAGFDDVEAYVAEHVLALAHYGPEVLAPMTDAELQASLAMCDESMAQIDRGEGISVEESRRKTFEALDQQMQ